MSANLRTKAGLKDYLLLMSRLKAPALSEQASLLEDWKGGDEQALRELVEGFLPRVILWVSPRRGESASFQELIAIGNAALIACLRSYKGRSEDLEARACQAVHDALDSALKMNA